jgi:branched-chain amino acid transport system permease protein
MALALSLVVGFLGELSLGHAGFMSLGAFLGGYLQTYIYSSFTDATPLLSLIVSMLIGGLIAAAFGFVIGLPALRLKGDYLAIVTLAFGEIVKVMFTNIKFYTLDGDLLSTTVGVLKTSRFDQESLFIIGFIVVLLTMIFIQNFIKSKHGNAVMAIRDNEIAARAMGVNVTFYKLLVFVISAFFAGVAGVLYSNANYNLNAADFDYNYSINFLVMVVLGGMGNLNGSILAAALISFLNNKLQTILTGDMAGFKNLFYALILIVIVVYTNAPKLRRFRAKYNLRNLFNFLKEKLTKLFTKKQPVPDPANEVEYGADWDKIPTKIEMDALLSTDLTPDNTYVPDKSDEQQGGKE